MARAGLGDARAFRSLVDRPGASLYRFILRQVWRPAIAQELLQETFLRAYRGAARYQPRAASPTWLFRIAVNLLEMHGLLRPDQRAHLAQILRRGGPGMAACPAAALEPISDPKVTHR